MGAMATKEVINGQRREGMETQVSDAEFIPGRVDESHLPGTMPGSNPKRRIKSFPTADSVVCDLTGDSYNDNGRGRSRGSGPATSSPTTRNTDKESCGTPAEKTSKGTPIDQGTAHHKRKNEDDPGGRGVQRRPKSAESQSPRSTLFKPMPLKRLVHRLMMTLEQGSFTCS
jgi:hypothetical protein